MIENRAHAEFNSVYRLCPNVGLVYLSAAARHPVDIAAPLQGVTATFSTPSRWCENRS